MKKKIAFIVITAFLILMNQGYGSQSEFIDLENRSEIRKSISLAAIKSSGFEQPFTQ